MTPNMPLQPTSSWTRQSQMHSRSVRMKVAEAGAARRRSNDR